MRAASQRRAATARASEHGPHPLDPAPSGVDLAPTESRALLRDDSATTPGGGARFRWADLDDKEISTIWDSVFGDGAIPFRSEERDLALYGRYIRLRTAMTMQEAQEVFLVCVMDSWPQWMAQRLVGRNIELHAQSENRAMTEDELARRAKRFSSSFEEKYRILRAGLKAMAKVNDVDKLSPPLDVSDKSPALN